MIGRGDIRGLPHGQSTLISSDGNADVWYAVLCACSTNEKIFDFKMTDDRLREILHENLRAATTRRAFDELMAKKLQAW